VGRPALLFAHSLFRSHADWVREVATSQRVPYVVIPHGSLDPWAFRRRWVGKYFWMQAIGRAYLKQAALVMFSSDAERRKAQQAIGFTVRSVVVRWPVDIQPQRPTREDQRVARSQLGLPEDGRILLYFGRYHSMKRPLETVRAFLEAAPSRVMLVLAGMDGDVAADFLRAEAGVAASNKIRVLGPVFGERRSALLTAADAFVSWSHRENFCYAAAEAMGFGRPVILSPGNDLRGELGTIRCGWFPENAEPAHLVDAIRQFAGVTDTELDEMGVTAHAAANSLFSRSGFVEAVSAIQAQLIA
jgi:glycosyltransferase involved in cell wall biosynthesis